MIKISIENDAPELNSISLFLPQLPKYHKLISKVYKSKIVYVKQYNDGEVTHVLPMAIVHYPLLGRKIVAMPYDGSFGNVICLKESELSNGFYAFIKKYAKENKIKYIEIRSHGEDKQLKNAGFIENISLIISDVDLDKVYTQNKYIKKRKKNNKLAARYGTIVEISHKYKDMKKFYRIMSKNMRSYGTPMYPYKYFKLLWNEYYESGNMLLIKGIYKGKMVSGLILLISGKKAVLKYSAAINKFINKRLYPTMKWYAMDICRAYGCEVINMGTSFIDDKGLISAKECLGATTTPLVSYTWNIYKKNKSLTYYQSKYSWLIKLWKYQPLWLSQKLGGLFWRWFC